MGAIFCNIGNCVNTCAIFICCIPNFMANSGTLAEVDMVPSANKTPWNNCAFTCSNAAAWFCIDTFPDMFSNTKLS